MTSNSKKTQTPKEYITSWLKTFVEVPHPYFNDLPPCPYAKQARLKNKVRMVWISDAEPDSNFWTHIENTDFDQYDVLVLITNRSRWSCNEAYNVRCELNKTFDRKDIVVLEDHPDYKEKVGPVDMSNGRYCLLLVQRKSKLNNFSDILKRTTKYYENWSKKELDDVVNWRKEDPQS
jgi:hypothetical protein